MDRPRFSDTHLLAFLASLQGSPKPVDLALSHYFRAHKALGATDRRAIGETVFGMARWKSLLDHLCPSESPRERVSCYRKISWESVERDRLIPAFARFGTSPFLYDRLTAVFGEEKAQSLCRLFNTPAPVCIRANLLKTTREALLERWKETFSLSPCARAPAGIQFQKREPLFALPEFKEGLFEVQDEGSQLVALLVKAQPGDWVLDFCSGSGGKTLAFAPAMEKKGQIFQGS